LALGSRSSTITGLIHPLMASPHWKFTAQVSRISATETYEAITEAFKHSAERKVDHTGCFSFEGQAFRCGVDYAGKRVLLRYDPSDLSSVEVFYKNERVGIATPIKVSVQGGNDRQTSEPNSVSFDKLMMERQRQSLERRLGAISFSGLEEDKDV